MIDSEVRLNAWEKLVEVEWLQTAILRPYVSLDAYVVMPNHFHGHTFLTRAGKGDPAGRPYGKRPPKSPHAEVDWRHCRAI